MNQFKYIPARRLTRQHIGKFMKLRLKNGTEIYGAIKEIRKDGIVFMSVSTKSSRARSRSIPFIIVPIFVPFDFFFPFIIF